MHIGLMWAKPLSYKTVTTSKVHSNVITLWTWTQICHQVWAISTMWLWVSGFHWDTRTVWSPHSIKYSQNVEINGRTEDFCEMELVWMFSQYSQAQLYSLECMSNVAVQIMKDKLTKNEHRQSDEGEIRHEFHCGALILEKRARDSILSEKMTWNEAER